MSDFRTVQEYMQYQEETAIPKLRWWQVQALAVDFPNDQELGTKVRELVKKHTK
tara:strand:+ start:367 stop:528 length:162 start_codon:yes stop_codon:yes gene_type:complete